MPHSSSLLAHAETLISTTELDSVTDSSEPYELCDLRSRLATDRERLLEYLENPNSAGALGLNELYWTLRFSWADLEDYIEEANNKVRNDEAGFRSELFCITEISGSFVPTRPRINRHQTLNDYQIWSGSEEYPISAWEEDDYLAATDDYEEEDYDEDYSEEELNQMDLALLRRLPLFEDVAGAW
jgi:hypothetical protein